MTTTDYPRQRELTGSAVRLLLVLLLVVGTFVGTGVSPASASTDKQLLTEKTLPSLNDWKCAKTTTGTSSCVHYSGYTSSVKAKSYGQDRYYGSCTSENCVHYVAWRIEREMIARGEGSWSAFINSAKCSTGKNAESWDDRARKCGVTVTSTSAKAGDILHFDAGAKIETSHSVYSNGMKEAGSGGHVAFIDKVETLPNGDQRLYVSETGCPKYNKRYTVLLSDITKQGKGKSDAGVEIIGVPYPPLDDRTFSDVPPSHDFYTEIEWAAASGLTTGYDDGTFRPTGTVSRQAMAAFLYRLAEMEGRDMRLGSGAPTFTDVPVGHPFRTEIRWLAQEGIITGYEDGTFRPLNGVSRMALSAFFYRFDGATYTTTSSPFLDVKLGHPFVHEIAWMKETGLATGYSGGEFKPSETVTRQAVAVFLYRYWRM